MESPEEHTALPEASALHTQQSAARIGMEDRSQVTSKAPDQPAFLKRSRVGDSQMVAPMSIH